MSAASQEAALRAEANAAMERYASGDAAAFRELYALTADRLFHYLLRCSRDPACAEDLMQQAFLHVHLARGRFTPGAPVFPWLYSIATRLFIDCLRKKGRESSLDDGATAVPEPVYADGAADEQLIGNELNARIERALASLPEAQRIAWLLVKDEELSYQEAAETLGKTVSSITSLVHRATVALQRAYSENG